MGDHHDGHAQGIAQTQDQFIQLCRNHRVQTRRWFIEKQQARIHDDRTRQRGALDHATGKLARHEVLEATQVDHFELDAGHDADGLFIQAGVLAQGQGHVVAHRHGRQQGAALERNPDALAHIELFALAGTGHIHAEQRDRATRRPIEAQHVPEQGALAGTRAAHDHADFAGIHAEVHAMQDASTAVPGLQLFDFDQGRRRVHALASEGGETARQRCPQRYAYRHNATISKTYTRKPNNSSTVGTCSNPT